MKLFILILVVYQLAGCAVRPNIAAEQSATSSVASETRNSLKGLPIDDRKYLILGDFNGDGYLDNAFASTFSKNNWGIVVHLDVLSDVGEIIVLESMTPNTSIENIRLETRPAGKYLTFCGQMPEECESDAPGYITLMSDGINLVILNDSLSMIHWDAKSGKFLLTRLTD